MILLEFVVEFVVIKLLNKKLHIIMFRDIDLFIYCNIQILYLDCI